MEGTAKRTFARAGPALGGAWMLGACLLGGADNLPTIAGHFGDRLEGLPPERQLDSSLKALEMMKENTGGAYRYRSSFSSWTGYGAETWIWVAGGAVTRREFSSRYRDSLGMERSGPAWTESGTEVGSHAEGHPPVLVDSLYRLCREILAADTTHRRMYFSLDRDYILSSCGSVHALCQDDCYEGISIEVRWD